MSYLDDWRAQYGSSLGGGGATDYLSAWRSQWGSSLAPQQEDQGPFERDPLTGQLKLRAMPGALPGLVGPLATELGQTPAGERGVLQPWHDEARLSALFPPEGGVTGAWKAGAAGVREVYPAEFRQANAEITPALAEAFGRPMAGAPRQALDLEAQRAIDDRRAAEEAQRLLRPRNPNLLERTVESAPTTLGVMATAPLGGAPIAIAGGIAAFGPSYAEARDRGVDPLLAGRSALADAAVQGVLEKVGVKGMLGRAWQAGGSELAQTGRHVAVALASEVPTEVAQELTSTIKEAATGKYASFDDWWTDAKARMVEAGKIAAVTAGAIGGATAGGRALEARAEGMARSAGEAALGEPGGGRAVLAPQGPDAAEAILARFRADHGLPPLTPEPGGPTIVSGEPSNALPGTGGERRGSAGVLGFDGSGAPGERGADRAGALQGLPAELRPAGAPRGELRTGVGDSVPLPGLAFRGEGDAPDAPWVGPERLGSHVPGTSYTADQATAARYAEGYGERGRVRETDLSHVERPFSFAARYTYDELKAIHPEVALLAAKEQGLTSPDEPIDGRLLDRNFRKFWEAQHPDAIPFDTNSIADQVAGVGRSLEAAGYDSVHYQVPAPDGRQVDSWGVFEQGAFAAEQTTEPSAAAARIPKDLSQAETAYLDYHAELQRIRDAGERSTATLRRLPSNVEQLALFRLKKRGLIDDLSSELSPAGRDLAAAVRSEGEAFRQGFPIEGRATKTRWTGTMRGDEPFSATLGDGTRIQLDDQHFWLTGDPAKVKSRVRNDELPQDYIEASVGRDREAFQSADLEAVQPVSFDRPARGQERIQFSNGDRVDARFFDYAQRLHPDAIFAAAPGEGHRVLVVSADGEQLLGGLDPVRSGGGEGGGSLANVGLHATELTETAPAAAITEGPRLPLELPEIVELSQRLMGGELPKVKAALRSMSGTAVGTFSPVGAGGINLRADLFSEPKQASATLAHEIGHLVDYLPEHELGRGNVLGHLAVLKEYLKNSISELPNRADPSLTKAERAAINRDAYRQAMQERPTGGDPAWVSSRRKELYSLGVEKALQTRGMVSRSAVMRELVELSDTWRPGLKEATGKHRQYRMSPKELYADAFSALLNAPSWTRKVAPAFHRVFFNYLERKPEVRAVYEEIQSRVSAGQADVQARRGERLSSMVQRGAAARMATFVGERTKAGVREVGQSLGKALVDRNQALYSLRNAARKKGGEAATKGNHAVRLVEEEALHNSEKAAYVERMGRVLIDPLEKAGVDLNTLDRIMLLRRAAGERAEMANPLGIGGEQAAAQLARERQLLGPEKAAAVDAALKAYWEDVRLPLLRKVEASGTLAKPLIEKALTNPDYAKFMVRKFIEDEAAGKASGLGRLKAQLGTLQEIGSPTLETAMQDFALISMAHRTEAARSTVDFLQALGDVSVRPAPRQWTGRGLAPAEPTERGLGLLTYMHDGKPVGYWVPEDVAEIFNREPERMNAAAIAWNRWIQTPLRALFVTHNPAFSISNLQKDVETFAANVTKGDPATAAVKVADHVQKAIRDVVRGGDLLTEDELSMLGNRALIRPGRHIWEEAGTAAIPEDEAFAALAQRVGLDHRAYENAVARPMQRLAGALERILSKPTEISERAVKLAGWRYLAKERPDLSLEQRAELVRNQVGTPNVYRRGTAFQLTNSLFMFSNVAKEGIRSSVEAYRANPSGFVLKSVAYRMLPRLIGVAAAAGVLGDDYEKFYEKIPENDKLRYEIVPLGWALQSLAGDKAVYLRLPQDHVGQFLGALAWKIGTLKMKPEDLAQLVAQNAPWMPSQFSPVLDAIRYPAEYAQGQNPTDAYRGRQLLSDREMEAGGGQAWAKILRASWNEVGSTLIRFNSGSHAGVVTELEKIAEIPLLGGALARFVKVSDYGLIEKQNEQLRAFRQEKARGGISRDDAINEALRESATAAPSEVFRQLRASGVDPGDPGDFLRRWAETRTRMYGSTRDRARLYLRSKEEARMLAGAPQ